MSKYIGWNFDNLLIELIKIQDKWVNIPDAAMQRREIVKYMYELVK